MDADVFPRLTRDPLRMEALLQETANVRAGALVTFAGTVRNHNESREVAWLEYSTHPAMAIDALEAIESEAHRRYDILCCRVAHRYGRLEIGELSVLVVVRAAHRAEAFSAARFAIEEIKTRVPIWKHEHYADGTHAYLQGCSLDERRYE